MRTLEKARQKSKPSQAQKLKKPLHAKIASTTSHAQHIIKITKTIFTKKSNMLNQEICLVFAEKRPDLFWESAHIYERKNARTAASLVVHYLKNYLFNKG